MAAAETSKSPRLRDTWPDPLWIFGYGSLVWKVDFEFAEHTDGYIEGYRRRFWQHSTDHRGTPGAPGRVATLIKAQLNDTTARVWGRAYRIAPDAVDRVMAHLDFREKGGYSLCEVDVMRPHAQAIVALLYVGTEDNVNYAGPSPLDELAAVISRSVGPSGPNHEYLYRLADAMRAIAPHEEDTHLFELEMLVRQHRNEN